ncbi:DUF4148 domain-containing protein [Paraburkholderia sacchari]|uniref:DUF4148 domain-containing protein n=1 Tax=Paraburkholderia sacchari TaxID=159450 RepID=UPI003CC82167
MLWIPDDDIEVVTMRLLFNATVLAVAIAAPLSAFAQTGQPLSRAEVRADLIRAEQAGYTQDDWAHYPEKIQAAQARIAERNDDAAYGASTSGSSQTGKRAEITVSPYSPPIEVIGH